MGNPFSEMQVRQIPLQTRNVVELLSVQPGVTSNGEVLGRAATRTTLLWTARM